MRITIPLVLWMGSSALALTGACAPRPAAPSPLASAAGRDTCILHEVGRRPVVLEGGEEVYVAPHSFVTNAAGDALLLGRPNYLFSRGQDGKGILLGQDSILGALVGRSGAPTLVRAPIDPHLVAGASALPRDDGAWDVVFAERHASLHDARPTADDEIVGVWHGVYRDGTWTTLERMPSPPGVEFSERGTGRAPLVRYQDRLAWAVGGHLASSHSDVVVVWERRSGRWEAEVVNTRSQSYISLAYAPDGVLLLTFVGADAMAPGESDQNSLFLWARNPSWRPVRRIVHGGAEGPAHSSRLHRWGDRMVLTWAADLGRVTELRATFTPYDPAPAEIIDPGIADIHAFSTATMPDGGLLWVTRHAGPSRSAPGTLRFSILSPDGRRRIATGANPLLATFAVASAGTGPDVLLSGAIGVEDAEILVSLVGRYRVACRAS